MSRLFNRRLVLAALCTTFTLSATNSFPQESAKTSTQKAVQRGEEQAGNSQPIESPAPQSDPFHRDDAVCWDYGCQTPGFVFTWSVLPDKPPKHRNWVQRHPTVFMLISAGVGGGLGYGIHRLLDPSCPTKINGYPYDGTPPCPGKNYDPGGKK